LTGAKGSEGTIVWGGYFNTAYFAGKTAGNVCPPKAVY